MKKIFKGLAILAASTAVCAGIGLAAGCSDNSNGTYHGEYHYMGSHGSVYGIVVEVTVKNNIITKVKNLTNSDDAYAKSVQKDATWTFVSSAMPDYGWTDKAVENWTSHENWLLQQYEGRSVKDILNLNVYTDYAYKSDGNGGWTQDYGTLGEPCSVDFNGELKDSGLLISGATQGSGRVALAVKNALSK
ncbi:MAG: hypothetical protein K2K60_02095 [Clostridia bacterium]|nr:hypothetical protein [Clostridia bacterium]